MLKKYLVHTHLAPVKEMEKIRQIQQISLCVRACLRQYFSLFYISGVHCTRIVIVNMRIGRLQIVLKCIGSVLKFGKPVHVYVASVSCKSVSSRGVDKK